MFQHRHNSISEFFKTKNFEWSQKKNHKRIFDEYIFTMPIIIATITAKNKFFFSQKIKKRGGAGGGFNG